MKTQFIIDSDEYKGQLNLSLTINSGQTSQPAWLQRNGCFSELVEIDGVYCLINVKQKNYDLNAPLEITSQSKEKIDEESIRSCIMNIFGLYDDLEDLNKYLNKDPKLSPTIEFCKGLRIFKAHNPFECIISSISSANCSIIRWNKAINDIKRKWGVKYNYGTDMFYTFPSPANLQKVPEHELEEMQQCEDNLPEDYIFEKNLKSCGVGYRAKYIIKTSQMVQNNINIQKLYTENYNKAFNTLLQLPGVGPKVADCILLYGFGFQNAFPVDVWIGRIISELYFNGEEIKPNKARLFGMEKFGKYAGYVQLYMFHYARKSGLLDVLKR
ncbi:MAG: DNA glycosylase [Methanobacterium sp.]|nr:DNA glycosylase [Methanobacterium sp.]